MNDREERMILENAWMKNAKTTGKIQRNSIGAEFNVQKLSKQLNDFHGWLLGFYFNQHPDKSTIIGDVVHLKNIIDKLISEGD